MMTFEKNYLKEIAAKCVDVEIYQYIGKNHTFHGDAIKSVDLQLDNLPDEVECDFSEMNEEEYNSTIMGNSCEDADFASWYGDKDAKVLVIVLDEFFKL